MSQLLAPLHAPSLKEVLIERMEGLILSGKLTVGQRLPSERELALQLGVSRPVVHEGLVELAARGLVTIRPRHGTVVNDYRSEGSLAMLTSLIRHQGDDLEPSLLHGVLDLRSLVEVETARLAARHRSAEQLQELERIVELERELEGHDLEQVVALDFRFHHAVAMAASNPMYPMLLKSFEPAYTSLTRQFFLVPAASIAVVTYHERLVLAIAAGQPDRAVEVMQGMLDHGRKVVLNHIESREPELQAREGETP